MPLPAAKQGDRIFAIDIHMVIDPSSSTSIPLSHPFDGVINGNLSPDINIMGKPAATVGSTAENMPPHIPTLGTFQTPPTNRGTIQNGSPTVNINGKPAVRNGDLALTCNDPADLPVGQVIADGTVFIG
ncbi:MAG: hypothetical protein HC769_02655 [Cyanobacteria bacterium CRU_2_1]|nr:hypothetical protein [Cyanobacteria bacterium RU_5_0]NJR57846.1 hypothetical protein [Cyanobacteria bacterium CRU_2_1]